MQHLYIRDINEKIRNRLLETRRFIQVLLGPRQVGKTTSILQVVESLATVSHYASADSPALVTAAWIETQWQLGRELAKGKGEAVLVLDEIHRIPDWSITVKRLWDEDTRKGLQLKVVLLGSSPLLVQAGLTESLAGRFEVIRATHWMFGECREYFDWDLDTYVYFGGYPAADKMIEDRERWAQYMRDSLIETTIGRDILITARINKPAVLRQLFHIACEYSSQIISYRNMLGQLIDVGNATTLVHYLQLLDGVGFVRGLEKYSGSFIKTKASSPKLQVYDTSLITSQSYVSFDEARADRTGWGRLLESAVGAHLLKGAVKGQFELLYWREGHDEVDFVVRRGSSVTGLEVKAGAKMGDYRSISSFRKRFGKSKVLIVGADGIPIHDFLLAEPDKFVD